MFYSITLRCFRIRDATSIALRFCSITLVVHLACYPYASSIGRKNVNHHNFRMKKRVNESSEKIEEIINNTNEIYEKKKQRYKKV